MAQKLIRLDAQRIRDAGHPVIVHSLCAGFEFADLALVGFKAIRKLLLGKATGLPVLFHVPANGASVSDPVHAADCRAIPFNSRHPFWKHGA